MNGFLFGIGVAYIYNKLIHIEPFSKYLPGGIGKFYTVHKDIKVGFDSIIGYDEVKEEISSHLKLFTSHKLSKGCCFIGPNGVGKTLMAKAVAGESKLPFIEITDNSYQGANIPYVLDSVIKKYAPCIIFIDECEIILNDYNTTLLKQIDGITGVENVFIIFASNKFLGKSITRSGRIDKIINFELPNYDDRKKMFQHIGLKETEAERYASQSHGLSYADISIIPREIKFAELSGKDTNKIIENIISTIRYGKHGNKLKLNQETRNRLAYHEIGHLMLSIFLKGLSKVDKVTIVREGDMLGANHHNITNEACKTKKEMIAEIIMLLASSVFEEHYCEDYSTLCANDIHTINGIFKQMENLEMNTNEQFDRFEHGNLNTKMIKYAKDIIYDIIKKHDDIIQNLCEELLNKETLYEEHIMKFVDNKYVDSIEIDITLQYFNGSKMTISMD